MSSASRPPVQTQPRSLQHVNRTRFYARRVHEGLTSRAGKCICAVFLTLLLIAGIIVFILWLSLRPHRPRFYLNSFSLAQLNSPIQFSVSDRNSNKNIGIYYGTMTGSVYYRDSLIASGTVMSQFYQPPKNTKLIQGGLGATLGEPVLSQISADEGAGRVELRFQLESTIRFKVSTWDTHQHHMHVSCDLVVGSDGNLLPQYINEKCSIYF